MKIPEPMRLALLTFSQRVMRSRPPDFVLGGYMERWHMAKRGSEANGYIHRFSGNDSDRALHDHPYDSVSCILQGSYTEHFHREPLTIGPDGRYLTVFMPRLEGEVIDRPAATLHRVGGVTRDDPVVSLFMVGPRIREWGFLDPALGWVPWQEYERAYAAEIRADQEARLR